MAALQKRIIIGLEDLLNIRVLCTNCHSAVVHPMPTSIDANRPNLARECPQCHKDFYAINEYDQIMIEERVLTALWNLRRGQTNRVARICFEIDLSAIEDIGDITDV